MELYIPGILLFLISVAISFVLAPRFTPLIVAVLSIAFLSYGVYDHYKMFASEYRLSTWQQGLQLYAPAIMIGAVIIFIIYAILAFFTKGSVPIPLIPKLNGPSENTATDNVIKSLNKINNGKNDIITQVNNTIDKVNNTGNNATSNIAGNILVNKNKNKNSKNNNVSRSFLETI